MLPPPADNNSTTTSSHPSVFTGKGSFPLNLSLLLESVDSLGFQSVVSWSPDGQTFVIWDTDRFQTLVSPLFFKSSVDTKLRSLYRKLNRWGFNIIRGTGIDGDMSLEAEGNLIAGGQQQYQVVSNNPAEAPNVNHISIRKGAWYHPKYNRTRAVECLQMATNTGDCSLLFTLLRPGIDDNNDNGNYGMINGSESEEGVTIVDRSKNKRKKKNQYPTVHEVSSNFSHQQQQQPHQQQSFQNQMQNVMNAGINNNQLLNQMQNIINAGQQIQTVLNAGINDNMGLYSGGQLHSPSSQQMMGFQMQQHQNQMQSKPPNLPHQQHQQAFSASRRMSTGSDFGNHGHGGNHTGSSDDTMLMGNAYSVLSSGTNNTNGKRARHSCSDSFSHNRSYHHATDPLNYLPVAHLPNLHGEQKVHRRPLSQSVLSTAVSTTFPWVITNTLSKPPSNGLERGITEPMSHTNIMDRMGMSMTEQEPVDGLTSHVPKFENAYAVGSMMDSLMDERLRNCSTEQGMKSNHLSMQKQFEQNCRRATMSLLTPIQEVERNGRRASMSPMPEFLQSQDNGNVNTQFWNNGSNLDNLQEMMREMGREVIAHHQKTEQARNQQQGPLDVQERVDDDDELSRFFETFAKSLPTQDLITAPIPRSSSAPFAELDDFSVSDVFSQRS